MTLHPIPSEFPYIWGKFCILFYQCTGQELMRALSIRVRNRCVHWAYASGTNACTGRSPFIICWAYASGAGAYAEHTGRELMRALSVRVRNWCSRSAKLRFHTVAKCKFADFHKNVPVALDRECLFTKVKHFEKLNFFRESFCFSPASDLSIKRSICEKGQAIVQYYL